ncbi:hypothetical protein ACFXHA_35390 [Nocardia sp. NPDC059240]|uniref:hypothetical protein n=1 Tax=Nocardia sp. NPDC059240 TaxID=3346786 RepID=UPI00369C34F0
MAASFDLHSVAVLGRAVDQLVIWHVNVGAAQGLSRLSGAWVMEDVRRAEIESLTAGFPIVVTGEEEIALTDGRDLAVSGAAAGIVDVDATVETVCAEIEAADVRFTEQDAAGGKYIRPQWPVVVPPGEVLLTQSQVDVVDDHIRPVLTLARALADLADAWAAFESLRLARAFLVDLGGPVARPLPLAVR